MGLGCKKVCMFKKPKPHMMFLKLYLVCCSGERGSLCRHLKKDVAVGSYSVGYNKKIIVNKASPLL